MKSQAALILESVKGPEKILKKILPKGKRTGILSIVKAFLRDLAKIGIKPGGDKKDIKNTFFQDLADKLNKKMGKGSPLKFDVDTSASGSKLFSNVIFRDKTITVDDLKKPLKTKPIIIKINTKISLDRLWDFVNSKDRILDELELPLLRQVGKHMAATAVDTRNPVKILKAAQLKKRFGKASGKAVIEPKSDFQVADAKAEANKATDFYGTDQDKTRKIVSKYYKKGGGISKLFIKEFKKSMKAKGHSTSDINMLLGDFDPRIKGE